MVFRFEYLKAKQSLTVFQTVLKGVAETERPRWAALSNDSAVTA
jgi:hypothetical protein